MLQRLWNGVNLMPLPHHRAAGICGFVSIMEPNLREYSICK